MKRIVDQIELFLLCFTVFMIPIHIKLTSVSIALLLVLAFFKKENLSQFKNIYKNPRFIILIFPYLFFLLGLINTNYMVDGWSQLEIVTSLIAFPVIFISYKTNNIKYRPELIQSFLILGVLAAYIICLSVGIPNYINTHDFNVLFYSAFSTVIKGPHHLSYCVIFVIIILVASLLNKTPLLLPEKKLRWVKIILILISTLFLFQLSSKATILLFIACVGLVFLYTIKKKMIPMKIAIPIMLIVTFGIVYMVSIPRINVRFANMFKAVEHPKEVNYQSHESTTLRFAAYKAGTNLIKQNFWFGVGTGDMSVEMSRFYKEHNLQGAYIEHISPHNQFMRSFVMHGVFGFLSIVAVFVMMFYLAIKEKHFLLFFWAFIMLVLFNVEDILGIQDGIVYFCFYTSYLVLCPNETKVIKSQLEIIPE